MLLTLTILSILTVGGFLAWPFWKRSEQDLIFLTSRKRGRRGVLREEKARLLTSLRELDFDYETRKLSVDDYKNLRAKYQAAAAAVLKELEAVESKWKKFEEELEGELSPQSSTPTSGVGKFCGQCGSSQAAAARFCGSCGASLGA